MQKILSSKSKTAALVRSTTALTIFNAGTKANVVPNKAKCIINHRIHPKDTIAEVSKITKITKKNKKKKKKKKKKRKKRKIKNYYETFWYKN